MSKVFVFLKNALIVNYSLILLLTLSGTAMAQSLFTVQIESVPTLEQAKSKFRSLKSQGLDVYVVKSEIAGKGTFYRLRTGTFTSMNEARKYGSDLKRQGIIEDFYTAAYEPPTPFSVLLADDQPEKAAKLRAEERPITFNSPPLESSTAKGSGAIRDNSPTPVKNIPAPTTATAPPPAQRPLSAVEKPRTNSTEYPAALNTINYVKFQDPGFGFAFERPLTWTGGPIDFSQTKDQERTAGAIFKSFENIAFIQAVWNKIDRANSPDNNNDIIVELILDDMGKGDETQELKETSRRVAQEDGLIKTYLDLKAVFKAKPGEAQTTTPLDFLGKAVIIRANTGVLMVAVFYSKESPNFVSYIAERVTASAKAPQ